MPTLFRFVPSSDSCCIRLSGVDSGLWSPLRTVEVEADTAPADALVLGHPATAPVLYHYSLESHSWLLGKH